MATVDNLNENSYILDKRQSLQDDKVKPDHAGFLAVISINTVVLIEAA